MPRTSAVCVFCGSAAGSDPVYSQAAREVGRALAREGSTLVYGGGSIGLMGILADAVLEAGGQVVGVIPEKLASKEIAHNGLTELIVVPGMHQRKALMAERATAFLMLPGGIGTFEEFFEIWTWAVLGIHNKPIGILNVGGYFDPLLSLIEHAVAQAFLKPKHRALLLVGQDPEDLVSRLPAHTPPPPGPLWIDLTQT